MVVGPGGVEPTASGFKAKCFQKRGPNTSVGTHKSKVAIYSYFLTTR